MHVDQRSKLDTVLVVDDEPSIRELIGEFFDGRYHVLNASNGLEAVKVAREKLPSVVLMDIVMPEMDGVLACQYLRRIESTKKIPLIMLTAFNEPEERIRAFNAGADDFISKPFHPDELVARVEAKVRRVQEFQKMQANGEALVYGNLKMDGSSKCVFVNGREVILTFLEFNLLELFLKSKGRLVPREEIAKQIWPEAKKSDRALDPHILSLRRKLVDFDHKIVTLYGAGFVLKKSF